VEPDAVSLAISSRYRRVQWDLIPYGNVRWYHDNSLVDFERKAKALALLVGNDPVNKCRHLIVDAVEPRTCGEGTADWFIDRQLSGTSSTIAKLVVAVAPLIDSRDEDESIVKAFEDVLAYAGYDLSIIGSKVKQLEEVVDITRRNSDNDSSEETDDEGLFLKVEAANWYTTLTDPATDMDNEFKAEAQSMDRVTLSWIVPLFKKKDYKLMSASAAKKTVIDLLLPCPKERRPYALLTLADLRKIADSKNIKATGLKKDALIDQLLKPAGEATPAGGAGGKKRQQKKEELDAELLPLFKLFKQSYLRQHPGTVRAAANIGHRNEEPFLKSFYDLCHKDTANDNDNNNLYSFSSLNPVAIFRLSLVRKNGSKFAKASLDGVTVIRTDDDDLCVASYRSKESSIHCDHERSKGQSRRNCWR
jgi:hypothetical protein